MNDEMSAMQAEPTPARSMPVPRLAERKRLLLAVARPRRRRQVVFACAGAVTAVAVTTGALVLTTREPRPAKQHDMIRCYSIGDPDGRAYTELSRASLPEDPGPAQIYDPVPSCASLFRQGFLRLGRSGVDKDTDPNVGHPVPKTLVACVLKNGQIAVLPGTECRQFNLPALSAR
ncbi:hypothetical protein [Actinomadura macrotermitis]|uniref:Uncharacterized protein n=1 Tax=Actinomadura macrotermitis TaxID=2585200 RepID=A0A7K0BRF1_9ACTN|nr:hypothetical protein [Actinomadura macrotermitis]MQY03749.1 hypothetical protein [Actinomadura macrotermitis]